MTPKRRELLEELEQGKLIHCVVVNGRGTWEGNRAISEFLYTNGFLELSDSSPRDALITDKYYQISSAGKRALRRAKEAAAAAEATAGKLNYAICPICDTEFRIRLSRITRADSGPYCSHRCQANAYHRCRKAGIPMPRAKIIKR